MTDHAFLRTAWTEALARGERPDPATLRAHLRAVHRDHAGFTEACAGSCRDPAGRTSYEWLAEAVPTGAACSVLDLACGSGPLLELLGQRAGPDLRLTGVDMCPEELSLARRRLPAGRVQLLQAEAQDLSALDDESVDVALCHWALTLMDPVAPVLAEQARVLRPGGRFAAIVDGPAEIAPGYGDVNDLIFEAVAAEVPGYGEIDLGDPRTRSGEALAALAREVLPGATVRVEPAVVRMHGAPERLAEAAAGFFYAAFVLSPARRVDMLARLARQFANGATNGPACFAMPINRIVIDLPDVLRGARV